MKESLRGFFNSYYFRVSNSMRWTIDFIRISYDFFISIIRNPQKPVEHSVHPNFELQNSRSFHCGSFYWVLISPSFWTSFLNFMDLKHKDIKVLHEVITFYFPPDEIHLAFTSQDVATGVYQYCKNGFSCTRPRSFRDGKRVRTNRDTGTELPKSFTNAIGERNCRLVWFSPKTGMQVLQKRFPCFKGFSGNWLVYF